MTGCVMVFRTVQARTRVQVSYMLSSELFMLSMIIEQSEPFNPFMPILF